jgi:hypothetical protein
MMKLRKRNSLLIYSVIAVVVAVSLLTVSEFLFVGNQVSRSTSTSASSTISLPGPKCVISSIQLSSFCVSALRTTRVAFINPIFTSTAYGIGNSNGDSFYKFFGLHSRTPNGTLVKADTKLLTLKINNAWGVQLRALSLYREPEQELFAPELLAAHFERRGRAQRGFVLRVKPKQAL